ncbi:MAG TPA: hypothetical protein VF659_19040 [Pyrinomonadaceae bacterium]|jgi:hypothetical protein
MRPRPFDKLVRALAACLLASLTAAAQEAMPAAGAKVEATAAAARLVVRVEYLKGAKPAFQPVPRDSWFGRFGVVATPRPRAAADTVQAVDVKTRPAEGGRVEIRVGVHVGERHFDRLEAVATYYASAGETVTAGELERVGVAPFVFSVLGVGDVEAAAPAVVNLTQSVEAVVTEFTPAPLPGGKLTLRNLSTKGVRAVYIRQVVNGKNHLVGFAAEREGKFLMGPGGSAESAFGSLTGDAPRGDFVPAAVEALVVASVIFDDYTYEGEPEHAALRRAFAEGQRAQLPRLIALLREALAAPDAESPEAVRRLGERAAALDYEAPPNAVDAVRKNYPGAETGDPGRWKTAVEISMHRMRRELLDDLGRFEKESGAAPAAGGFKGWLGRRRALYEAWLARL